MDQHRADSQRPAFPAEAVTWLVGAHPHTVAVLGDPDLAAAFAAYGHDVTHVADHGGSETGDGEGEDRHRLPFPDRSVDVVLASGSLPEDLAEVARVLRPGGLLTLVCNERDHRIPWARKLDAALAVVPAGEEPASALVTSQLFGFVSDQSFRYWQHVNHASLEALLRDELADHSEQDRETKVAAALALYADYGRGADGMQLPWVSRCFKATVVESAWAPPRGIDEKGSQEQRDDASESEDGTTDGAGRAPGTDLTIETDSGPQDGSDSDLLLIDFR